MKIHHGESWVSGPGTRKLDPEDRDRAIADVALDLLREACIAGRRDVLCPGCITRVAKADMKAHAQECDELRADAAGAVDD